MTTVTLDIPVKQKDAYVKVFSRLIRDYSIKELEELENTKVDLVFHDLSDLTDKQKKAYYESFNEDDLINI